MLKRHGGLCLVFGPERLSDAGGGPMGGERRRRGAARLVGSGQAEASAGFQPRSGVRGVPDGPSGVTGKSVTAATGAGGAGVRPRRGGRGGRGRRAQRRARLLAGGPRRGG